MPKSKNPIQDYDKMYQAETKMPMEKAVDVRAPEFTHMQGNSPASVGSVDLSKMKGKEHYDENAGLSEENKRMRFVKATEFQSEA